MKVELKRKVIIEGEDVTCIDLVADGRKLESHELARDLPNDLSVLVRRDTGIQLGERRRGVVRKGWVEPPHGSQEGVVMVLKNHQQDQPMSRCASPDPWRVHPDLKGFPGHVGAHLVVHANPVQRTFDVVHPSTQAPPPLNGAQHYHEAEFE